MELACEQCSRHCTTVWTCGTGIADTARMLAWNVIERLRDHYGEYIVVVTCRHCRHAREMTPAFLARHCRGGWDEPLAKVVTRFRCRCGRKTVDVQVGFNSKPRGWVKNPS